MNAAELKIVAIETNCWRKKNCRCPLIIKKFYLKIKFSKNNRFSFSWNMGIFENLTQLMPLIYNLSKKFLFDGKQYSCELLLETTLIGWRKSYLKCLLFKIKMFVSCKKIVGKKNSNAAKIWFIGFCTLIFRWN